MQVHLAFGASLRSRCAQSKTLRISQRTRTTVFCLSASFLAFATPAQSAGEMGLPGKVEVNENGAAKYLIPIKISPGTAGVSPSLRLEYSSQSGNGLLGVGWSVSGLPSIGRCVRTIAQDNVRGAVKYDADDRFCIDGQRLVAISGTYGADGTEYRTEVESFTRVISRGVAGTGPAWFEVWTKSGQRMEFGNTADSRVLAEGKTTARLWSVSKVSDTKGNSYTVTYTNDTANGQAYPSRIDYTANVAAGLSAYNSVRFTYATRPDSPPAYHAGSVLRTAVRLTNVQAYAGATLVWDYRLAYQQSPATDRSQLTSVTLCDGASLCQPATTFTWQNGSTAYSVISNVAGKNGTLSGSRPYIGDFNGDGLPDILWNASSSTTLPTSSGTRVLWTGVGDGTFVEASNFAGQNGTLSGYAPFIADFNRDGRSDLWWYQANAAGAAVGATTKWLSTSGGAYASSSGPSITAGSILSSGVEINGDNRADIIWYRSAALENWTTNSDGTVTTASSAPSTAYFNVADLNGDRFSDIVWENATTGTQAIWLGSGNGTFQNQASVNTSVGGYRSYLGDLNGDGKSDILWDKYDSYSRSAGQRIVWLSKADGTFSAIANPSSTNGTLSGYRRYLADFDGDGKTDVLWDQAGTTGLSTGTRVLWISKGDGTFTVVSNFAGQNGTVSGYVPLLADFNGDGKADVLWDSRTGSDTRSTGTRVLWLSDGVAPDLVTSVQTGIGATSGITYRPLTDGSIYTKDSTAADPVIDLQMAMRVVSRLDLSNGIGGSLGTAYTYAGAKGHHDGRGFLGFRKISKTDVTTGRVESTEYLQAFPYIGLVASQESKLGSQTLSGTVNVYNLTGLGGTRYFAFLTQSQTTGSDLDGTVLPVVTTTYQYDAYGNATEITEQAGAGHTKTTTNTYANDTANWLIGRLLNTSVTSTLAQSGLPSLACSLPWGGTLNNGQSVTAYASSNVAYGGACTPQTRSCYGGVLTGSYAAQSCSVAPPASCSVPAETAWTVSGNTCTVPAALSIAHGATATATDSSEPTTGSATYSCSNGTSTVQSGASCTASCTGLLVGGYCWHAGAASESCSSVCATRGGYNNATKEYAGSGGTNANCKAVVDSYNASIGFNDVATSSTATGYAAGCVSRLTWSALGDSPTSKAIRYTSPITTDTAVPPAGATSQPPFFDVISRMCACNN